VFGVFISVAAFIGIIARYLFTAQDMGSHVSSQAKINNISTWAMWGRMFKKTMLYIFLPAFIITAVTVTIALLITR
jgi:hypothetical protein